MKKIIIGLILVVLLLGCTSTGSEGTGSGVTAEAGEFARCDGLIRDDKTQCQNEVFFADKGASFCEGSPPYMINPETNYHILDKDYCYEAMAAGKRDYTFCDNVSSQEEAYNCYFSVARSTDDFSICEELPEGSIQRSNCEFYKLNR